MTDKMTDNEIIKALEHCTSSLSIEACDGCPMNKGVCDKDLNALEKHALDLIKRQKTEIEILIRKKEALRDEIAEKDAEIERLEENQKSLISHIICGKEIMKEALVDFCEKAKEATFHYYDSEIDSVYKELTESNE